MAPVAVVLGFGGGVSKNYVDALLAEGYVVALVSRSIANVQAAITAASFSQSEKLHPYECDLSMLESIPLVLDKIAVDLGPIDVAVHNAAYFNVSPADFTMEQLSTGLNINIGSLHVAFKALLPMWLSRGKGKFIISGGGLGLDGTGAAMWGAHFAAAAKAYQKNFAQSHHASYSKQGIHVCCLVICGVVLGSKTVEQFGLKGEDSFKGKVRDAFATILSASKDTWTADMVVAP